MFAVSSVLCYCSLADKMDVILLKNIAATMPTVKLLYLSDHSLMPNLHV